MALKIKPSPVFDTFEETIVFEEEISDRNLKANIIPTDISVKKFAGLNNWHPFDELKSVTKEVFRELRNEHSSSAGN
jgi:hypothetical protein